MLGISGLYGECSLCLGLYVSEGRRPVFEYVPNSGTMSGESVCFVVGDDGGSGDGARAGAVDDVGDKESGGCLCCCCCLPGMSGDWTMAGQTG